ncbi:DinB family protein [Streptomyces sp. 8N616]|uniref:DinB family protein n=1 Tax=Streptomyces sp. 8N616 TaxID=3457414 RepID=UPI003FD43EAC
MKAPDVLADAFGRIHEVVHEAAEGLTVKDLHARLDPRANSIAWLVWHLSRIQDDHVADASGQEQVWLSQARRRLAVDEPLGTEDVRLVGDLRVQQLVEPALEGRVPAPGPEALEQEVGQPEQVLAPPQAVAVRAAASLAVGLWGQT